ncbi:FG-GAP-like repeat-containing protein [Hymenobacter sp. M29]|uniref:FG-GAP-like repeat-containing protein n=1 Tax=Hymenobacter mellowenesis TaxID=3063995 RepID=A0ABT9AHE4_9BACT|nr:FG-GAP-like repeat-containing protein [Hymenobacter sp. M29]MDO7848988.1 FG-GAP-like repeat-containing protein [Hymenobacter sp. M29]
MKQFSRTILLHPVPGFGRRMGMLAGLLAGLAPMAFGQNLGPKVDYTTGVQPFAFALGDVTGDGRPDIVTANASGNSFSVLPGLAGGTFGPKTDYTALSQFMALADVNTDGRLDVVTGYDGGPNNSTLSVLLGLAGGGFGPKTDYALNVNTSVVKVADVTGDGRLDLVAGNSSNGTVSVLPGLVGGTFGTRVGYTTTASYINDVAVADVTADGRPDIITTHQSGAVSVLPGLAAGGFGPKIDYTAGTSPKAVAVGDVNNDGRPDVVVANSLATSVSVLLGQAGGRLGAKTDYTTAIYNDCLALKDLNGDGKLDIVTAGYGNGTNWVSELLSTSTGYAASALFPTGLNPRGIAIADLNADGKFDVATVNSGANSVSVLLNQGTPVLTGISPSTGGVGTVVTLTGTGLSNATVVRFTTTPAVPGGGDVTSGFTVNAAGTQITGIVAPNFVRSGPVEVVTAVGTSPTNFSIFFNYVQDLIITGTQTIQPGTYNNITVRNGATAQLGNNVTTIGAVTVENGGTFNDNCFVLTSNGSFVAAAGATLGICNAGGLAATGASGAIQGTGTRSFAADASYRFNGSAAQVTGTGLPAAVRNLTVAGAGTVTLSAPLTVAQVLALSGAGNFALNGQALTLPSGPGGTALVVNSGTGVVSGSTATVQRYLNPSKNPGLGYRHYSAPVSGSTVADLATAGFTPEISQGSVYNTSATPGLVTPFPTVYGYDQARIATVTSNYSAFDKGFFVPAALSTPLEVGRGYVVQIGAAQLVDFTGQPNTGPYTLALDRNAAATPGATEAGWQLLGNPYPAPIDFRLVDAADRANLDASVYVIESSGPYTGAYRAFVNGVGSSPLVGSGQSFFVRVSDGQTAGSFTFRNNQRLTTFATQAPVYRTTADARSLVQLALRGATGAADDFFAYAETGATPAYDIAFDAVKLANSTGLNLSSAATTGERLAIDGRAAFTAATVLSLNVGVPAAGTYSFAAAQLNNLPAGLDALLTDAATGQTVNLRTQPSYSFSVSTAQANAVLTSRFTLRFAASSPLATASALTAAEVTLYPNPAHDRFSVLVPAVAGATQVQGTLLNALGQTVRTQLGAATAQGTRLSFGTSGLAAGVYTLRLRVGTATLAKRVVIQ